MFVRNLEIKNLRSFEYLSLSLSPKINIIIGPNNSGKTTIIKSLYTLQDLKTLNSTDIRTDEESYQIFIEIVEIKDVEKPLFRNEQEVLLPIGQVANLLFDSSNSRLPSNSIDKNGNESLQNNLESILSPGTGSNYAFIRFEGFPTAENRGNFIYPFLSRRKSSHLNSQTGRDITFSVMDNFQNLPAKIKKVTSHPALKERFDAICKDILGFPIGTIPGDGNEDKVGMYAGINLRNPPIPIESMGEGVINIVGLITIMLTENGKLFLIEELENDIHPLALKKLLKLITEKSRQNQFIISTHSNIVLKQLGSVADSKIFSTRVKYSSEKNLFTSSVEEISTEPESRRDALEQLGYEFADYDLHSGWLFFEESSAEEIIRDFFIPWYFSGSKIVGYRTFSTRSLTEVSAKFEKFNEMFVYLHLTKVYKNKAWVIIDGGDDESQIIKKLQNSYAKSGWNEENFIQLTKHDFEEYYPEAFREKVELISRSSRQELRKLKASLLHELKEWIKEDIERAKAEFEKSATEIIEILKKISNH